MAAFATHADVSAAWRTLTADEQAVATTQLEFASAVIRRYVDDVDTRIADGTLDADLVKHVAVAMVLRHMRNPEGLRSTSTQQAIDDYSETVTETRDQALSAGSIYLTDEELSLIAKRGRRAFSIAPSVEPTTCAIAERAAINRASWNR